MKLQKHASLNVQSVREEPLGKMIQLKKRDMS